MNPNELDMLEKWTDWGKRFEFFLGNCLTSYHEDPIELRRALFDKNKVKELRLFTKFDTTFEEFKAKAEELVDWNV